MIEERNRWKEVSSRGIFINGENKILLVKPLVGKNWLVPGGRVESKESPVSGCKREIMEEIGLEWKVFDFCAVDYNRNDDDDKDTVCFVFYCGIIESDLESKIILQDGEINDYGFFSIEETESLMSSRGYNRLKNAFEAKLNGGVVYLEDGVKIL